METKQVLQLIKERYIEEGLGTLCGTAKDLEEDGVITNALDIVCFMKNHFPLESWIANTIDDGSYKVLFCPERADLYLRWPYNDVQSRLDFLDKLIKNEK